MAFASRVPGHLIIVQALARQLGARVEVDDMHPGARISIIHAAADKPAVPVDIPTREQAV